METIINIISFDMDVYAKMITEYKKAMHKYPEYRKELYYIRDLVDEVITYDPLGDDDFDTIGFVKSELTEALANGRPYEDYVQSVRNLIGVLTIEYC